jgi:hypothetical protein
MLDDDCSDFFAMLDDRPPNEDKRGPVAWLAAGANHYLTQEYVERYPNGEPRILVQLCRTILKDWDRDPSATWVAYLKLVRLAQAIMADGTCFPASPEADEAARWLKIVADDIDARSKESSVR